MGGDYACLQILTRSKKISINKQQKFTRMCWINFKKANWLFPTILASVSLESFEAGAEFPMDTSTSVEAQTGQTKTYESQQKFTPYRKHLAYVQSKQSSNNPLTFSIYNTTQRSIILDLVDSVISMLTTLMRVRNWWTDPTHHPFWISLWTTA